MDSSRLFSVDGGECGKLDVNDMWALLENLVPQLVFASIYVCDLVLK